MLSIEDIKAKIITAEIVRYTWPNGCSMVICCGMTLEGLPVAGDPVVVVSPELENVEEVETAAQDNMVAKVVEAYVAAAIITGAPRSGAVTVSSKPVEVGHSATPTEVTEQHNHAAAAAIAVDTPSNH